ncbi:hypothetical protein ACROYT_G043760 [Oculina patagonica]
MNCIFKTGSERTLNQSDFLPLSTENSTCFATEKLKTNWNKEISNYKGYGKRPKLWKSVTKLLTSKDAIIIVFTSVLNNISCVLQPLFLGYLVSALMSTEPQKNPLLYGCTLALSINALIACFSLHQQNYRCEILGIKISSALKGLIYHKTLLLSKHALLQFTTGHVIDLISNDVQRMEEEAVKWFFVSVFRSLDLVAISILLAYLIGWQALMGAIFLCLLVPYFALLSYVGAALRVRTAALSDRRISLMNQVVSGIRAIKAHAWEDEYRKKINHTRRHEISIIRKKSAILSVVAALLSASSPIATLLSVITLVLTGQHITPANVFILLGFINLLRNCTCVNFAQGFLGIYDAYASLGRIEHFLLLENLPAISGDKYRENKSKSKSYSIKLKSGLTDRQEKIKTELEHQNKPLTLFVSSLTCKEIKRENEFILQDIEFTTTSQSLTVITGPVGCGKSTVLSAIAGEVADISGTITFQGTLVYVPQIAWIFSGTIRENILFGQPYDEPKYTRIIEACALTEDMQKFPDSDQTVVGERGEVLSGGQQARVSLARAVYADADLYLLDDPLSAVDFKVGQHIFQACIKDLLGNKTRLLTSHQEQHMKEADEVVVLYKGRVLEKGSFTELKEKGVLNTTVDPLYKTVLENNKSDENIVSTNEEKSEVGDSCGKVITLPNVVKSLQISEEDRAIGVVSFKLYWDYFRSGIHWSVIFAAVFFCFISQGMVIAPDVWLSFLTKKRPEDQKEKTNLTIYACLVVLYISKYYLKTSRELKRLESICRSPVFSHISETLNGLDTIRTRGRQRDFVDQFYRYQDVHNQSYIMVMASGRWLGVRLDLLASLLIGAVALAAVLVSQDAAFAGLALVYVIKSAVITQYAVRKTSDVENFMTSVERVMTYTKLDSEPGYKVERLPPENWPRTGTIVFQDVSLTYYSGGPRVLKEISLNIKGGAKIGVAGRTGAGKSSFVTALMRMPDADGEIMVDDIPIKDINLKEARRCISVLGQSPVLFSGSLRKNLDLVEQFQDADLWRALENVQLKELVEGLEGQLDHEMLEHGANVSVGERQLICLARVLLQQSKIIILDEPTAHVDPDTEQTIWKVVREKLSNSTVITIAHRLNTIRDCDMILVLKNGEVDGFGRFDSLLNRERSSLREMARVAGI